MRKRKFAGIVWVVMLLLFTQSAAFADYVNPIYVSGAYWGTYNLDGNGGFRHDILAPNIYGTPVYAIEDGRIRCVQTIGTKGQYQGKLVSYGNVIYLYANDGKTEARYAHLSGFAKCEPDYPESASAGFGSTYTVAGTYRHELGSYDVKKGEIIGYVGTTGNSSGSHLHFELWLNGQRVAPDRYISIDDDVPPSDEPSSNEQDLSDVNPGLRRLSSSSYAKVYTLTSGHYDVYNDSSLTTKLSSTAWTGENDEDWITGVGRNTNGTVYARISYPTGSGRLTACVSLKDVFVPGDVNEEAKTAVESHYGLYKRKNSGQDSSYGIDTGDSVYLLTKEDGWCQVLYPTSGGLWRIAWLPESDYNKVAGTSQEVQQEQQERKTAPRITTFTMPDAYIGEEYYAKIDAIGTTPITYTFNAAALANGFRLDGSRQECTTGVINGTPINPASRTLPYTVNITIKAQNSVGSASRTYTVTVRDRASRVDDERSERSRNLDNDQDFPNIDWNNQNNGNSDTQSLISSGGSGGGCTSGFSILGIIMAGMALAFRRSR